MGASSLVEAEREIAERARTFPAVVGLYAKDLTTGETIAWNAETRFPTASLVKVAVMAETYRQIRDGRFTETATVPLAEADKAGDETTPVNALHAGIELSVADLLRTMIVWSDNTATNLLIRRIGTANVNGLLDALGLRKTRLYRPTFRDGVADVLPEEEREFGLGSTTPREAATFFERLAEGKVVSKSADAAMIDQLADQQDRAMIPRSLPFERDSIRVAHKTGWDAEKLADSAGFRGDVRNDAALVEANGRRYVIAICFRALRDRRPGVDNEALRFGGELSRLVYDAFVPPSR